MTRLIKILVGVGLLLGTAFADLKIPMASTETGKSIGYIIAHDTAYGLLLTPFLFNLSSGIHGFHVHTVPDCGNQGMAAGGHLDPYKTNLHMGPYIAQGHLGDLPALTVNQDGTATLPVLAPRLTIKLVAGHSLIIHSGGDNYSDSPEKLGGGGSRLACGVIPEVNPPSNAITRVAVG